MPRGRKRPLEVAAAMATPDSSSMNIPPEFTCPITLELMIDPVIASDGHTYERKDIEAWLASNNKSPKTNLPLPDKRLIPNIALRQIIDDFRDKNGIPRPAGASGPRSVAESSSSSGGRRNAPVPAAAGVVRVPAVNHRRGGMSEEEVEVLSLASRANDRAHAEEFLKRLCAMDGVFTSHCSGEFAMELMTVMNTHSEYRIRMEIISVLPNIISVHGNQPLLETTLDALMSSATRDHDARCRKAAIEACSRMVRKADLNRTRLRAMADFFYQRMMVESGRVDEDNRAILGNNNNGRRGASMGVASACVSSLARADQLAGRTDARPEYEHFLSIDPSAASSRSSEEAELLQVTIQSLVHYQHIPGSYAELIARHLTTARGSGCTSIRQDCVKTLFAFAKKLPDQYPTVLRALVSAGRGDPSLSVRWDVLESIGGLRDASGPVIELLIEGLGDDSKEFLWWHRICNAAATSVSSLVSSNTVFGGDALRMIEREKARLLAILNTSTERNGKRYSADVTKAAWTLVVKVDPSVVYVENTSNSCTVS
jgi:U-box domain